MFRETMNSSSGETTVFMRHLVLVILYGWLSGMKGGMKIFIRPKHVEKRNKHTKKNFAPRWPYLQDYTGMHGQ